MNRRKARRIRSIVLFWIASFAIATLVQHSYQLEVTLVDALTCAIAVVALEQVHRHLLPQMRRAALYLVIPLVALIYEGVILLSALVSFMLLVLAATRSPARAIHAIHFFFSKREVIFYPFFIAIAIAVCYELGRRIGPPRLLDLITGRYRIPRAENRVFLLIDLRGSTPLAEKLGAVAFSSLLRDIFDDLTEPALDTDAQVVGYVGDEAILSWPIDRGLAEANSIRCFEFFKAQVQSRFAYYEGAYGVVPSFRAATHAGLIVATEVGQLRTDVALHGDALNTAARILAECNALDAELLVSETVSTRLPPCSAFEIEPLGSFQLRGKGEPIGLGRVVWKPAGDRVDLGTYRPDNRAR